MNHSTKNLFPSADEICRMENPLNWTEHKSRLMVEACREFAIFHQRQSPEINHLYGRYGFHPESLESEKDLAQLPSVGVTAMKYFLLTSLPENQAVLKLTSSGTRGQKTQIWFDQASLDRVQSQLLVLWEQEGLVSLKKANYMMFVYDPDDAKDLGIAFSCQNEQRFAPPAETVYAIKKNSAGEWQYRREFVLEKMQSFAQSSIPVRISGIPSFIFDFLLDLEKKGSLRLPQGSTVMTGGGWKAAENKKVSKESLREQISTLLGIPDEDIRDGYGMAEHSAPYIECRKHRFHIPVYCRILVRDPRTLELLPPGKLGFLELITPYNAMMPNLALYSTDLGFLDEKACECGWNAPTFTLVGRGGLTKHKGCAITAAEIVKRGS